MADYSALLDLKPYNMRGLRNGVILFVFYIAAEIIAFWSVPTLALHPGFAIALGTLFFTGLRLLPVVFAAALAAAIFTNGSFAFIAAISIAATLKVGIGAYLLKTLEVDPIFRREHDVLRLIATVGIISFIAPLLFALANIPSGMPYTFVNFLESYVATLFPLLIITPFILRWVAKPRFRRTSIEIFEVLSVFAIVLVISVARLMGGVETIFEIPLTYLLFVPLFWIALRLRPRFVTLALFVISLTAISGMALSVSTDIALYAFRTELFLIATAATFLIVTSLEEHRRANASRFFTQVATLQNAVARVNSESQAKNDFIAILAHELRNPLAPVVSGIELLQLKSAQDPSEVKTLSSMARSLETVRTLLNDLLDVSRISEGKIALEKERVDLESALKRAVVSTDHHRKERHQNLTMKTSSAAQWVLGDPVRLEQIFSNLLTNASKYSNSGDTITILMHEDGDIVKVEVADEGVGLEPDALDRIFLPFEQVQQGERTKSGLGIGLALVRDFVAMHSGTVHAESPGRGKGSRFIVRLPIAHA